MSKIPFIEQMEHSECGLACLAMILAYHKYFVSLTEIRNRFDPPREGISFFDLIKVGERYQLDGKAYSISDDNISQLNRKNISLPFIAHWNKGKHFVVVEQIYKNHIKIIDPIFGRRRISIEEFQDEFTGKVLIFTPKEGFQKKRKPSRTHFFTTFISRHKKWIISTFIFSVLLQVLGIVPPLLIRWITDNVLLLKDTMNVTNLGISILIIFLSYLLFSVVRGFLIAKLQRYMDKDLMENFIHHLFKLPYRFFEQRSSGDLLFRANSHTMIRQLLSSGLIEFIIDAVLIVTYALIMLYFSMKLGITIILISLTLVIILIITTPITLHLMNQQILRESKIQSFIAENINNVMDIKVTGVENKFFNQWENKFKDYLMSVEKSNVWRSSIEGLSTSIQFIVPLFLLWLGISLITSGQMSIGTLFGFNALAGMFINPVVSIGNRYIAIIQLSSIFQRLFDVFDATPERKNGEYKIKEAIKGKIELKNLNYRYDSFGDYALKNINLEINPGEKIGIVGVSGSGKSTLAKLITGLYQEYEGKILFDNINMKKFNLQSLRKQIGSVLQETSLFNKSILENIALQDEDYKEENAEAAAMMASIHNEIIKLPMGYHSILSEVGVNLSGGQRQRLLLARALYNKPSILVLDEATGFLDQVNENKIEASISKLNCTRIVIAHRLNTIRNADKIIVMNKGEIVESGSHAYLMELRGKYYNLYDSQKNSILK